MISSYFVDRALSFEEELQRSSSADGPHLSQKALVHYVGTVSHEVHMGTFRYMCLLKERKGKKGDVIVVSRIRTCAGRAQWISSPSP